MGYCLIKQPEPFHRWRVSCAAGVLRVSSKLGSSHRTLTTRVEAYAPPCKVDILPFWRGFTKLVSKSALRRRRISDFVDSRLRGNDGLGGASLRAPARTRSHPNAFGIKRHTS